jgi:DNA-directed RNA polymerase subunit RPC12/RpoP
MNQPYRELALVPIEPEKLAAFSEYKCPKCAQGSWQNPALIFRGGICFGRKVGLCKAGCNETREHFHIRCKACGSRFLMAPANAPNESTEETPGPRGVVDTGVISCQSR